MKRFIILFLYFVIIRDSGFTQDFPAISVKGEPVVIQEGNRFILYEQIANPGSNSYTSQNFESLYDSFDTQGSDDFIINVYPWTISSVEVLGVYYAGTGPATSVNVWFYHDSSGHPGVIASSEMNIVPTGGLSTGSFLIPLTPYVNLSDGTYWLSVQCNMDFSTGGQWGWTEQIQSNLESNWQNPLGGFLTTCSTWAYRITNCDVGYQPYFDFSFRINGVALPVELQFFKADVSEGAVELIWMSVTETNNKGFEVQRSSRGELETIAFIEGHGTTTESQFYSYTDKKVSIGLYSYRLKQIDFDGSCEFSDIVEVDIPAPVVFVLEPNYPNPFNPSTKIKYSIPQSSNVELKVFDILGNEIATLVNEEKPAGTYEVEFNSSTLSGSVSAKGGYASGVYFYQLKAGSFLGTKKMILMK